MYEIYDMLFSIKNYIKAVVSEWHKNSHGVSSQSGELTVCGNDFVAFPLQRRPAQVNVEFESQSTTPCNPDEDELLFRIYRTWFGTYILYIEWSVSGIRDVKWNVKY